MRQILTMDTAHRDRNMTSKSWIKAATKSSVTITRKFLPSNIVLIDESIDIYIQYINHYNIGNSSASNLLAGTKPTGLHVVPSLFVWRVFYRSSHSLSTVQNRDNTKQIKAKNSHTTPLLYLSSRKLKILGMVILLRPSTVRRACRVTHTIHELWFAEASQPCLFPLLHQPMKCLIWLDWHMKLHVADDTEELCWQGRDAKLCSAIPSSDFIDWQSV